MRVALHPVCVRLDVFDPELLAITLPTRGAGCGEDFEELRGFHERRL
jgi:hypothetical protein